MPFPTRYGNKKNTKPYKAPTRLDLSVLKGVAKATDRAGSGFIRWMVTDHTHTELWISLIDKPYNKGFWPWVRYFLKCLFVPIGIALARAFLIILLYIVWIPFVFWLFIFVLTH